LSAAAKNAKNARKQLKPKKERKRRTLCRNAGVAPGDNMHNHTNAMFSDNIKYIAEQTLELMRETEKGRMSITTEERELLHDVMLCARSVIVKCICNK
jgi:hypothetical protein